VKNLKDVAHMLLKKCLIFFTGIIMTAGVSAGNDLELLKHVEHQAGFSLIAINDPYLSLLTYQGTGFRYNFVGTQFLNPKNTKVSFIHNLDFVSGLTSNPASTASLTYTGGAYKLGFRYHFKPVKNFTFLGGGLLRSDFMLRSNSRNVNNPVNVDVAVGLNAQVSGKYDFRLFKKPLSLTLNLESPFLGLMFVPHPGLSYYEIYLRKNIISELHVSTPFNKVALNQQLKLIVPFSNSVWSIGIHGNYQQYKVYDFIYRHIELSLMLGVQYDLKVFSGKKANVPAHYLTPGL